MSEKSALTQRIQIGPESTPGTGVVADTLLQGLSIQPGAKVDIDTHRPAGTKWPTLATLNKEWTEAKVEGKPTYNELVYPLSSVYDTATITTPVGCTAARLWTFDPASAADDTPITYTVEAGSEGATDGIKFVYGIFTGLELKATREALDLSGDMIGEALQTGQTMTAAPTAIPLVPVLPGQVCVYLDDTAAALGTTKLLRAFDVNAKIADRHSPVWALNCTESSFVATVEGEPTGDVSLKMAFDTQGSDVITHMRAGDTKFLRIEATGAEIDSGVALSKYRMTLDFALKVVDVDPFEDNDGIYAIGYKCKIVHDATWTRALKAEVVTTQTAL